MFSPHSGNPLYTAEQVEQIRRETVEACAQAFFAESNTWGQVRKTYLLGAIQRQGAKAIRALLEEQE
jgi:hypothetical protein